MTLGHLAPRVHIPVDPKVLFPSAFHSTSVIVQKMARLIELQGEADSSVEYGRFSFGMFALLIAAAYSSWTIQPTETRQVGEERSVIRLGLWKPCQTDFRQRENMYLHVNHGLLKPHQTTLSRMPREACCFSGRGWMSIYLETLRTGSVGLLTGLGDAEIACIRLCSLCAKASVVLWCRRYNENAI